ncbi:MAG: 30S ribosomal protein S6 [Patescibacteria group bacterium]
MNKYELLLVLPGTLDEKEAAAKTDEVVALIKEVGQEAELKVMGKNRLAYPIQQVRYGYFYTIIFSADTENIKKIETKLRLTRGLLRAIVARYNKALDGAENTARLTGMTAHVEAEEAENNDVVAVVETAEPEVEISEPVSVAEAPAATVETEPMDETPAVEEEKEEKKEEKKSTKAPVMDLKEIDKKLDEILADDNLNI